MGIVHSLRGTRRSGDPGGASDAALFLTVVGVFEGPRAIFSPLLAIVSLLVVLCLGDTEMAFEV